MKIKSYLIIVLLLLGCSRSELKEIPQGVIPQKRMVDILVDIHLSDAILVNKKLNTKKHEYQIEGYYKYLYEKHGYTREEIDSSIAFYSMHPEVYSKMYDDILEKLNTIHSYYEKKDTTFKKQ